MRIVIVDDSRTERMCLRRVLRNAGHDVVGEGSNGEEAIKLCHEHRPDVLLIDVAMRGMHGDVAARLIKQAGTVRHIVIVSSNINFLGTQYRREGFACVSKPHTDAAITAAIEKIEELERGESLVGPCSPAG